MEWPKRAYTHDVVKRNKRLHIICRETEESVYSPPDFLRLPTREPLQGLAGLFDQFGVDIRLIMEFETHWTPRGPVRQH